MVVVAGWNHTQGEDNHSGSPNVETQFSAKKVGHSTENECSQNHAHHCQGKEVWDIIGLKISLSCQSWGKKKKVDLMIVLLKLLQQAHFHSNPNMAMANRVFLFALD